MKKIQVLLTSTLIALFLMISGPLSAHFGPRGLTGGTVSCAIHYGGLVYLGTEDGGVFESTNAQLVAWRLRAVGLKSGKITALAHSGEELYTATADSGIFIFNGFAGSDRYWNKRNSGLGNLSILSLVAIDTNTVIAGSNGSGLFKTSNKGLSWTAINSTLLNGKAITALVKAGSRIIALASNSGAYASDDNGNTWFDFNDVNTSGISNSKYLSYNETNGQLLLSNNNGLFVLAAASTTTTPAYVAAQTNLPIGTHVHYLANDGSNWYLASHSGVFTTPASAISWTAANTGLPTTNVTAVVAFSGNVFAGTHKKGVFKSATSSISWVANNTGMTNIKVYALATKGDSTVATATEYGVAISRAIGLNPVLANNGLSDSLNVNDLEFGDNLLFAATKNAGIFVSSNLGQNWAARNSGLGSLNIKRLAYSHGRIYAIDSDGKVFQSDLQGTTWTEITSGLPANPRATSLAFFAGKIILGTLGNGVFVKNRDAATWVASSTGLTNLNVTAVAASDGKMFAGTDGSGVFVADMTTGAWSPASPITSTHFAYVPLPESQINRIQHMIAVKGYVLASFKGGVVGTHNHGATWDEAGVQFNLPSYSDHMEIGFVTSRFFVITEDNNLQGNGIGELPLVDTLLSVLDQTVIAPATASTSYHSISSNINWQISVSDNWVTPSVTSGFWNRELSLQLAANTGASRSATVTLTGGSFVRTIVVSQEGTTAIDDDAASRILLYPNPNQGRFTIDLKGYPDVYAVSLLDITGKEIRRISTRNQQAIEVSENLLPGVYLVRIQSDKGSLVKKMTVN